MGIESDCLAHLDLLQSASESLSGSLQRQRLFGRDPCSFTKGSRLIRVFMDPAHCLGGLDNGGFCPKQVLRVRADLTPDRDEFVANEERVASIHEFQIAGISQWR